MIVTTSARTTDELNEKAKRTAKELGAVFVKRNKKGIRDIQAENASDCLVVGKERLELYRNGAERPFFFHPNLAFIRIKRLMEGETDPYIQTAGIIPGSTVLDCTLGLGADAVTAAYAAGPQGNVTACETEPLLAYMVQEGLKVWRSGSDAIDRAMRSVNVIQEPYMDILKRLPDNSFDVVYFDPMFEQPIEGSKGIEALGRFAARDALTEKAVIEAKRVAAKRVVLKDHYRSSVFKACGFNVQIRKSAKFHYGFIDTEGK